MAQFQALCIAYDDEAVGQCVTGQGAKEIMVSLLGDKFIPPGEFYVREVPVDEAPMAVVYLLDDFGPPKEDPPSIPVILLVDRQHALERGWDDDHLAGMRVLLPWAMNVIDPETTRKIGDISYYNNPKLGDVVAFVVELEDWKDLRANLIKLAH